MPIDLRLPSSNINIVTFSGFGNLTENIRGEMELVVESFRCNFDMNNCEKFPGATVNEMCKKFIDKTSFYSSFFDNIKPPLKCPLKAGIYKMLDTKMDFSAFSMLPLDGFVWVATFKILLTEPGAKKKRIVMCVTTETKIVKTGNRKS